MQRNELSNRRAADLENTMSRTTNHTPTPYSARESWGKKGRYEIRSEACDATAYAPIAYVQGDKRVTGGDGQLDAAFIVRACNAHEQLVGALKDLDAMYARAWDTTEGGLFFSADSVKKFESAHDKAKAALLAAGAA